MNERISLDPESLAEGDGIYLKALANLLGHDRGVFAEAHPNEWLSLVNKLRDRTTSELARARISEFKRRAKTEFLLPASAGSVGGDWESCAQQAMSAGEVTLAISDRHGNKYPSISSVVLEAHPALAAQHAIDIKTTPDEYIRAFEPLVLHSSELHLLDGYAYTLLRDAVLPTFKQFLALLAAVVGRSRKKSPRTLYIHCWLATLNKLDSTAPSIEFMQDRIQHVNSELRDLRDEKLQLQLVIRSDDEPHDRFLFGRNGALNLGWGLHLAKPVGATTITILPTNLRKVLHARYLNNFEQDLVCCS